jgi:outer membrane protein, heavy metal efflux system
MISPRLFCLFAILFVTGCAEYKSLPIIPETIDARLAPPPFTDIRAQAKTIKHPVLQPVAFDETDGLSTDEAAILAVLVNPSLRAVRDQQGIAEAQLLQAGILPNPQLSYSLDFPSGGSTAGTTSAFGLGLNWNVTALISRSAKIDAAKFKLEGVDLAIAWQEWQIAQTARVAVYRLVTRNEQVQLSLEMQKRLQENLKSVSQAVNAGLLTGLRLAAARTAFNKANVGLQRFQKQVREQKLLLNRAMGLPPKTNIKLQVNTELPENVKIASQDSLVRDIENRRLDILALRKGYESQEASVRVAIKKQFPKINIGLTQARDTSNLYTAGFGVSISLPIFNRNQGKIALAQATRQQLFDDYVNRVFLARSNIAQLTTNIQSLNRIIQTVDESIPNLEDLVNTYRMAVTLGHADILNFYTAWNNLTAKRIELLSLKLQLVELRTALEISSGFYKIESEEPGSSATK